MATTSHSGRGGVAVGGSAGTSFAHGTGQVAADLVFEWDFDNDGNFDETVEDITSYVMAAETLSGRDWPSAVGGKAVPGEIRVTVRNDGDEFAYFNTASPLNTSPFSLRTGRRFRIRDAAVSTPPPALLASDRFDRPNALLGTTGTGQTWTAETLPHQFVIRDGTATPFSYEEVIATIDVGEADHYVQVEASDLYSSTSVGVVARWTDASNYVFVILRAAGEVDMWEQAAGVWTQIGEYAVPMLSVGYVGCRVSGTSATAYIDGVPVITGTLTGPTTGTEAGIIANRATQDTVGPAMRDFNVWDDITTEVEGIIATGSVLSVAPSAAVGSLKTATIVAEGQLVRAQQLVQAPLTPDGAPTGRLVGNTLGRAGLLHPPGPISEGTVTTGPVPIDDGQALDMARLFETHERGFLHETNEGAVGFDSVAARAGGTPAAVFSDAAGAQFGYSSVDLYDWQREVVNRVYAGVAAEAPANISITTDGNSTALGVANDVAVTMPEITPGDLILVFIASAVANSDVDWLTPLWWGEHRNARSDVACRVYGHFHGRANTDNSIWSESTVTFYDDTTNTGGGWVAIVYRISNWHEDPGGGEFMGEFVPGKTPGVVVQPWGREPTLFIAVNAGMTSVDGASLSDEIRYPIGYGTGQGVLTPGFVPGAAAGIRSAYRIATVDAEAAGSFVGLEGFVIEESVVYAVRGYNGPHTVASLQNPSTTGGTGRVVQVDDLTSQIEHAGVSTPHTVPALFATEADAETYGQAVLAMAADDRPILSLSFYATTSAAHRAQAIRRRVGDMVYVVASNSVGFGIDAPFYIESVGHRWTNAGKRWECTWQLSPA